jgi:hypothetical protein
VHAGHQELNWDKLHIVKDVVVIFREAFHPSIRPIIIQGRKRKITPRSLRMCRYLRKACLTLGGHPQDFDINISNKPNIHSPHNARKHTRTLGYICCLRSFTMVSCMLLSHGSQAMQTSRFSTAKVPMNTCGMWYIERFWKCSL